jgi:hypothetical protein
MKYPFRSCIGVVVVLTTLSLAQSDRAEIHRSFLHQNGCPLEAISSRGSAVVLKNVSNKSIVSYALACFAPRGKKFETVVTFDASQASVAPGGFTSDGGFDASPLNQCKSRKWLLGISEATFTDKSSWKTPWSAGNAGDSPQ